MSCLIGSSCCLCVFQDTACCWTDFTYQTRNKSHRVGHWASSRSPGCVLAFLFFVIFQKMDLQPWSYCCNNHSYSFIPYTCCHSARSYSFGTDGSLVPISERHTANVRDYAYTLYFLQCTLFLLYSIPRRNLWMGCYGILTNKSFELLLIWLFYWMLWLVRMISASLRDSLLNDQSQY